MIDYSAQNDGWSKGHDSFARAMNERKYALILYWGPFGHANNHANILKVNDLINSFDWLAIKKNESYPVFTNASTNGTLPWPDHLGDKTSGQVNAFFRWQNLRDTRESSETQLSLVRDSELKTTFSIPSQATADVSLRRLQQFHPGPNRDVQWTFGKASGVVKTDATGLFTIPGLQISAEPTTLTVKSGN